MNDPVRVLFVDDEAAIVESFSLAARFAGVEVEGFTHPAAALERFRAGPEGFRAVITDFVMTEMTCSEFIARIRAVRPGMPVHLCTGTAEHEIESAVAGLGVGRVLYKPFDFEALAAFLEAILEPGP